uniref:Uncharacterized protein n=1 Tax=Aegilops tauschii subsp. strangulata TaxID=200361 RepID=A0A453J515_AEGTS
MQKNKVGCVLAPFCYLMHLSFFLPCHDVIRSIFLLGIVISIAFLFFLLIYS